MRKHRLAERLLTDVIGLGWAAAHAEACRWEHVMSEDVERRLVSLLHQPATDPYGNFIPGLEELAGTGSDIAAEPEAGVPGAAIPAGGVALAVVSATNDAQEFVVVRIGELLQADADLMASFEASAVRPGTRVQVTRQGSSFTVREVHNGPNSLILDVDDARCLFVTHTADLRESCKKKKFR
jgi:DtxR family Mn-dependent transcriptional regulator